MLPLCADQGIGVIPWSPPARARGAPREQIALAWVLAQPAVTAPIIGATKVSHVEDAVAAVDVLLTAKELASLAEPYQPRHPAGF